MPIGDHDEDLSGAARQVLLAVEDLFIEPDEQGISRLRRLGLFAERHRVHRADTDIEQARALVEQRRPFAILASSGIPGFVDPGYQIIDDLLERYTERIELVPIGMSSALDAALCASGAKMKTFVFAGHFPQSYRLDRAVIGLRLPLVAFVRGDAIREWVSQVQAKVRGIHRHLLFRDVRKKGRSRMWVLRSGSAIPDDLVDDPHHDFVVVVTRQPSMTQKATLWALYNVLQPLGKRLRRWRDRRGCSGGPTGPA